MTPPIGVAIATFLQPKKFTQAERDTGISCLFMGLCFITEGVLPFAANDPLRFIPCSMVCSAIACGIAMGCWCRNSCCITVVSSYVDNQQTH